VGADDDPGPAIGLTGARFGGAPRRKARKRAPESEPAGNTAGSNPAGSRAARREAANRDAATEIIRTVPASAATPPRSAPHVPSPPSPAGPGTAAESAAPETEAAEPADASDGSVVGYTGARFGGGPRRRKAVPPPGPEHADAAPSGAPISAPPVPLPPLPGIDPEPEHIDPSSSSFVRPYVLTKGRTRSSFLLSIETLVSAVPMANPFGGEHEAVIALVREPRSVAEVAALLGVPLGVARVLVGDLAAAGAVAVHRTAGAAGPDLALMERVLTGLRRL
jgi:hypothetical protein